MEQKVGDSCTRTSHFPFSDWLHSYILLMNSLSLRAPCVCRRHHRSNSMSTAAGELVARLATVTSHFPTFSAAQLLRFNKVHIVAEENDKT